MQDLRVIGIRSLSELGAGTLLEVAGKLVLRAGRRLYDHANHPDPMMDLEEANVRFHSRGSSGEWQAAPGLSINRGQIVLLAPMEAGDGSVPFLRDTGREVFLNLICGQLQVAGTLKLPVDTSVGGYIHQAHSRFLAVSNPRIRPFQEGLGVGDFASGAALCYVNTQHINVCMEARRPAPAGTAAAGE